MSLKTKSKTYLLIPAALVVFGLTLYFHTISSRPQLVVSKQDSALNLNQYFIKFFTFGNKRLASDMIWIQTLLESDMEKYTQQDLGNWLYIRFLTISQLDEKFYENYQYGGMFLSVIKDDLEGAEDLYERGLKIFPDDYKLNFQAGFNSYLEMGNYEKGLKYLKKIENHPDAAGMLKFIIKKLEFETGRDFDLSIAALKMNYDNTKEGSPLREKLEGDIFSLTTERDLECLNAKKENCQRVNLHNQAYVYRDGNWVSPVPYSKYRIHRRSFHRPKADQNP